MKELCTISGSRDILHHFFAKIAILATPGVSSKVGPVAFAEGGGRSPPKKKKKKKKRPPKRKKIYDRKFQNTHFKILHNKNHNKNLRRYKGRSIQAMICPENVCVYGNQECWKYNFQASGKGEIANFSQGSPGLRWCPQTRS